MSSKSTVYAAIELSFSSWLVAGRLPGTRSHACTASREVTQRLCWR